MHHDREIGVSEGRFGLPLLICLLLAVGYLTLHHLGSTGQMTPVEIRPGLATQSPSAPAETPPDSQQPQVLPIESSESAAPAIRTSQRPVSR